MREYEVMLLVNPELDEEKTNAFLDKIKEQITQNEGNVKEAKVWKKDKLAYEIQNYKRALYLLISFESSPDFIKKLKRFCKLDENILRFLFIKHS